MEELIYSILALGLGAAAYDLLKVYSWARVLLDGFILTVISGLIFFVILPESFEEAGAPALLAAFLGFLGPVLFHYLKKDRAGNPLRLITLLGVSGLTAHAFLDGVVLATGSSLSGRMLIMATILHRFSMGLGIWWIVRPAFGLRAALALLGTIVGATVLGFYFSLQTIHTFKDGLGIFQAFMMGSLLHVLFRHKLEPVSNHAYGKISRDKVISGLGALLGAGFVLFLTLAHSHEDAHPSMVELFWLQLRPILPVLLMAGIVIALVYFMWPGFFAGSESRPGLNAIFKRKLPDMGVHLLLLAGGLLGLRFLFFAALTYFILFFLLRNYEPNYGAPDSQDEMDFPRTLKERGLGALKLAFLAVPARIYPLLFISLVLATVLAGLLPHLKEPSLPLQYIILTLAGILYPFGALSSSLIAIVLLEKSVNMGAILAFWSMSAFFGRSGLLFLREALPGLRVLPVLLGAPLVAMGAAFLTDTYLPRGSGADFFALDSWWGIFVRSISGGIVFFLFLLVVFRQGLRDFLAKIFHYSEHG